MKTINGLLNVFVRLKLVLKMGKLICLTKKRMNYFSCLNNCTVVSFLNFDSHKTFNWSVLEVQQDDTSIFYQNINHVNITDVCSHPDTIRCGTTGNFPQFNKFKLIWGRNLKLTLAFSIAE